LNSARSRGVTDETARERGCDAVYVVQAGDEPGSPLPHLDFIWYGAVLQRRLSDAAKDAAVEGS
jgi:hypothetical protein